MSTSATVTEPESPSAAVPVSGQQDDFAALEERVVRTVELLKAERQARVTAEQTSDTLQHLLDEQSAQLAEAEARIRALTQNRDQVRGRVERMMKQLDEIAS